MAAFHSCLAVLSLNAGGLFFIWSKYMLEFSLLIGHPLEPLDFTMCEFLCQSREPVYYHDGRTAFNVPVEVWTMTRSRPTGR
jgi:hypothetical protein